MQTLALFILFSISTTPFYLNAMYTTPVPQPQNGQKVPLATEFENWIKILERGKSAAPQAKEELQRIITCNTQHDTSEVTKCVIMMEIMNRLLEHPCLTTHKQ